MSLLAASNIYGGYGGVDILNGVSLRVEPGEIVTIVGPNGAGKSTFIKALAGLVTIRLGDVRFEGRDITNIPPEQAPRIGISYVPQERNVFTSMTVMENLEMGAFLRSDDYSGQLERIFTLFPRLRERRSQPVWQMSGGERQMVAMGRALMLEPKLLILDEPTAGLSPLFMDQVFEQVKEINALGIGILMVEQNAKQALAVSDRGYVLAMGRNRFEDRADQMLQNKEIAEMFLGG
ncbi:ABC transporter ATP-binding protein [Dichotomicrobium thermohalophilum]|uniref:Amino acid/amide ABC transporter ATP-binding protein 2 (HAAT family) n=1 Tax=Dichotomicrobium thermohalophilum TaxID=933063 RepID=A0A397QAX0_9HYPH|nr:ABC transporter ATP-binding protein [Dichotomicrobium thermohalophilum]RIA55264.1 amino acid/amide ABC transporter ATP-binding protein 2 (HAAT family) [Dichotomicrobium thermohalophilum]